MDIGEEIRTGVAEPLRIPVPTHPDHGEPDHSSEPSAAPEPVEPVEVPAE